MHRDEEEARVVLHDGLRTVAVVDVEVDDGDAGELLALRHASGDRDIGEQAKAHGASRLRVVTGGAHGAEGAVDLAAGDRANGFGHRAGRAPRGGQASR